MDNGVLRVWTEFSNMKSFNLLIMYQMYIQESANYYERKYNFNILKIQVLFVTFTHPLIIIIMTELYQRLAIIFLLYYFQYHSL